MSYFYRIFYTEEGQKKSVTACMRDVFVLMDYLNVLVKSGKRHVTKVVQTDENGVYISTPHFFEEEVRNQKWYSNPEARLLQYAKINGLNIDVD